MENIIKECLIHAEELKASCIAFPALGAGNLKYPINVVSKVMITTVANYLEANHRTTKINKVKIVIYMEVDFQEFCRVFKSLQANDSGQMHTALSANDALVPSLVKSSIPNNAATTIYPHIVKKVMEKNIMIEIILGDITDDSSDAIVCPINKNMDFAAGGISAAILNKGGPEMQAICNSILDDYCLKKSEFYAVTASQSLKCKNVFYAVSNSNNLGDVIAVCLSQAEKYQLTSIALPALGTGASQYSVGLAADIMYVAIGTFALLDPVHVKTVRIILDQQHMVSCYTGVFTGPALPIELVHCQEVELKPRPSLIARARSMITSNLFSSGSGTKTTKTIPSSNDIHSYVNSPVITAYSELMVVVFADDIKKVEKTETCLQQLIESKLFNDKIDDTLISKLTSSQQADIEQRAKDMNVDIAVDVRKLQHNIQLKGDLGDIMKLRPEIHAILNKISAEDSKLKDILSVQAKVKWQWENPSGGMEDYDPPANYAIEQAYQSSKAKLQVYQSVQGLREEFDFQQMKARDLKDQSVYKIKRLDCNHSKDTIMCTVYHIFYMGLSVLVYFNFLLSVGHKVQ